MIETKTRTINGGEYRLMQLPSGNDGLRIFRKLHKWVGPALGALFDAQRGQARIESLGKLVGDAIADDEFWALIERLLVPCTYNGREIKWSEHWVAHYADMHALAVFALETNYGPVFSAALGSLDGLLPGLGGTPPGSTNPSTSTSSTPGSSPATGPGS